MNRAWVAALCGLFACGRVETISVPDTVAYVAALLVAQVPEDSSPLEVRSVSPLRPVTSEFVGLSYGPEPYVFLGLTESQMAQVLPIGGSEELDNVPLEVRSGCQAPLPVPAWAEGRSQSGETLAVAPSRLPPLTAPWIGLRCALWVPRQLDIECGRRPCRVPVRQEDCRAEIDLSECGGPERVEGLVDSNGLTCLETPGCAVTASTTSSLQFSCGELECEVPLGPG